MSAEQMEMWENGDVCGTVLDDYDEALSTLCQKYPSEQTTLVVDWSNIYRVDHDVAEKVRSNPAQWQESFKSAVIDKAPQQGLVDRVEDDTPIRGEELEVRFKNVGDEISVTEASQGDDVGNLATVRGQIAKATPPAPRVTEAAFICQSCGAVTTIHQPKHGVTKPDGCELDCKGQVKPSLEDSQWVTHQLVRLKHPPGASEHDVHIDVHLTRDSAGGFSGGENVDITGVVKDDFGDFDTPIPDFYIEAHHVRRHQSSYEEIDYSEHSEEFKAIARGDKGDPFQLLTDSIAPGIAGDEMMDRMKLALALQLFGGWRIEKQDGTGFRGDIHQLFVGAPGTGKSDMLDSIERLSPKVSRVSGKNVSKKALTAAGVKDDFGDSQWSIQAGAFVKAHKGTCIIDEVDKVDGDALSSLHSALEKQQVNAALADKSTTLACETAFLGAANPTNERFIDPEIEAYTEQIPLGVAMRTRMDAVFLLPDNPEKEHDEMVVESFLDSIASGENVDTASGEFNEDVTPALDPLVIRSWVAYARQHCFPKLDMPRLKSRIKDKYVKLRQDSAASGYPIAARKIGSIVRYSIASARVRLGEKITDGDIDRAMSIVGAALSQTGLTDEGNPTGDSRAAKKLNNRLNNKKIRNRIAEYAQGGIDKSELSEKADMSDHDLEQHIQSLMDQGRLYEPKQDHFMAT